MTDKQTSIHPIGEWVIVTSFDSHWMDFTCYNRVLHSDGSYSYYSSDELCVPDLTEDLSKAVPSLKGFIKWDGCYQITEIADMPLHWDSGDGLDAYCAMLRHIPVLAKQMESWEGEYNEKE